MDMGMVMDGEVKEQDMGMVMDTKK